MKETIQIVNKSAHALPAYQTVGSAGMDLIASLEESITLKPMERKLIKTGIFIALTDGYEAQIRPRSGMAYKRGLTVVNAPGTIDSDYRGEIMVAMINLSTEDQIILDGDRVAQIVIAKYEQVNWEVVTELNETVRGTGGFNSTGSSAKAKPVELSLEDQLRKYTSYVSNEIDNSMDINSDEKTKQYNEILQETKLKLDEYVNFLKNKK